MVGVLNRFTKRIGGKRSPTKGDRSYVTIAIAEDDRTPPVEQLLGGYVYEVTVPASPADGSYVLVIDGFTHTFAAASTTTAKVIDALTALINLGSSNCLAYGANYSTRKFRIAREVTFAVTATSPTSSMTVGSIQTLAAVTKGATSITLPLAVVGTIKRGNWILFVDANENYVPVQLTADAVAGDTTITVDPVPKAISAGAAAEFPSYLWDAVNADVNRSFNRQETTTYNTGQDSDGAITGGSKNFQSQLLYNVNNAALKNCFYAIKNNLELYVSREFQPPTGYSRGRIVRGASVVTGLNDTAPVGNATVSPQFAFNGTVQELDEVPLPY